MFSFLFRRTSASYPKQIPTAARRTFESLEDRSVPAVFAVTTVADDGVGSLRDAVAKANANGGADQININVAASSAGVSNFILQSGEIAVTDDLTIVGQGMTNTGITGNRASRVFNVEGAGKVNLRLQDLSLYQGLAQGEGGAVRVSGGRLQTLNVDFYSNAADKGGAVAVLDHNGLAGEASFTNTVFDQNVAGTAGGGVYVNSTATPAQGASVLLSGANFFFNTVSSPNGSGGGVAVDSGAISIQNSSLVSNQSNGVGGGVFVGAQGGVAIANSTLAQNSAASGDGGGAILSRGRVTVANSTISGNTDTSASNAGGVRDLGAANMVLSSTIIANNVGLGVLLSPDLQTSTAVSSDGHNLVENATGVSGLAGTDLTGIDPKLGPIQYNGSNTASLVPLPGSPVIGKGSNSFGATTDQRGDGYARVTQGAIDIGAVQFDAANTAPLASLASAPSVGLDSSMTQYDFVVTYTDDKAVGVGSLDNTDILVTGPNGFAQSAKLSAVDQQSNAATINAQYTITPPGGKWTPLANGSYTITLQPNQAFDAKGRPAAGAVLGSFQVAVYGDQLGYVESLYRVVLGRSADADGLKVFQDRLNQGDSRKAVAQEIWNSNEHRILQVAGYYRTLLGREPDADGLNFWVQKMQKGATELEVQAAILGSKESESRSGDSATIVDNLYQTMLDRPAEASAQPFVDGLGNGTMTSASVAKAVLSSPERSSVELDSLYMNVLLRPTDDAGRETFLGETQRSGEGATAVDLLASDEFYKLHGSTV